MLLMAAVMSLAMNAQSAFFKKCDNLDGVTTVYISKTMMKFAKNMKMGGDGMNFAPIIQKVDNIEIVTSESEPGITRIRKEAQVFNAKSGYEELMKVNDSGEKVTILSKTGGKTENEFVIFADEGKELSVIIIRGPLTVDDIAKVVN